MNPRIPLLLALGLAACGETSVPAPPAPEPGHDHASHEHAEAPAAAPTAHDDHGDAHAEETAVHGDDHAGHGAEAPLPQTYTAALADLGAQASSARRMAEAGELKTIHPLTERIEKLSVALPGLASTLADGDRARVTTAALAIKKTAGKLHHAADEGKKAEIAELLDTLDADIAGLPAGQ